MRSEARWEWWGGGRRVVEASGRLFLYLVVVRLVDLIPVDGIQNLG